MFSLRTTFLVRHVKGVLWTATSLISQMGPDQIILFCFPIPLFFNRGHDIDGWATQRHARADGCPYYITGQIIIIALQPYIGFPSEEDSLRRVRLARERSWPVSPFTVTERHKRATTGDVIHSLCYFESGRDTE